MRKLLLLLALTPFAFSSLSSCSADDEETENITITPEPENPVVINADYSYTYITFSDGQPTVNTIQVPGPWFKSKYSFTNNGDRTVTIASGIYTIKSFNENGTLVVGEATLDSGDLLVNKDTDTANDQNFIAEVLPGQTVETQNWYIDSLTKNKKMSRLNYSVTVELVGWFGDHDNPEKSFKKRIYFNASE